MTGTVLHLPLYLPPNLVSDLGRVTVRYVNACLEKKVRLENSLLCFLSGEASQKGGDFGKEDLELSKIYEG